MNSKNGDFLLLLCLVAVCLIPYPLLPFTVVIDAGHGGAEKGAVHGTLVEKSLTLHLAQKMRQLLSVQKGIRVVMTREEDITLSLEERARIVNENTPDLFVSIHFNTDPFMLSETRGFEIYYPSDDTMRPLGDFFPSFHRNNKSFVAGKFVRDRYLHSPIFTIWKHDLNLFTQRDLKIFRLITVPSLLLEIAYLSSDNDRARIENSQFLDDMAAFLVETIVDYARRR